MRLSTSTISSAWCALPAAILGTITAVGGGCARDLVLLRPPRIFISGTLYASATFLGALLCWALLHVPALVDYAATLGVASILIMRFISVFFKIETRPARDYSDLAVKSPSFEVDFAVVLVVGMVYLSIWRGVSWY